MDSMVFEDIFDVKFFNTTANNWSELRYVNSHDNRLEDLFYQHNIGFLIRIFYNVILLRSLQRHSD